MKCDMSCKDKLDIALKLIFVGVFTWGVMSLVCCMKSCDTSSSCCKNQTTEAVKPCSSKK